MKNDAFNGYEYSFKKIDYLDTAMENISLQVIQKGRFNSALVLTSPPQ